MLKREHTVNKRHYAVNQQKAWIKSGNTVLFCVLQSSKTLCFIVKSDMNGHVRKENPFEKSHCTVPQFRPVFWLSIYTIEVRFLI